jgi:hypothetical protein
MTVLSYQIDASNYTENANGLQIGGLPDPLHSNFRKDFFVVYTARYCSGTKIPKQGWNINFCSRMGSEFFNSRQVLLTLAALYRMRLLILSQLT